MIRNSRSSFEKTHSVEASALTQYAHRKPVHGETASNTDNVSLRRSTDSQRKTNNPNISMEAPQEEEGAQLCQIQSRDGARRRRSSIFSLSGLGGIYPRSVFIMISTLLLGLASAAALHGYYSSLNGKVVGTIEQQQTALRYDLPLFSV